MFARGGSGGTMSEIAQSVQGISAEQSESARAMPARRTLRAVEWLNFFLADVQTGLGPFLAAYLAANGWKPGRVGYALTFGGLVTVLMQTPAGAVIDAVRRKRALLAVSVGVLVVGALALMGGASTLRVYAAQLLIGGSGPFLGPTVAAITLGITGAAGFDRQFGRNQAFNSAGNVFTALLVAYVSYEFGYRAIFVVAVLLAIPTLAALAGIDGKQIDYGRARGGLETAANLRGLTLHAEERSSRAEGLAELAKDRVLVFFLGVVFLFHLANAAMLPQLGEMLAKDDVKKAAPFMSACIIVTQVVIALSAAWIGKLAAKKGRRPLLLLGFGVLPIRGVLYTLTASVPALIGIQILDGVANVVFVVVGIVVIKDRTEGTGRFNLASGALATTVGVGAALSNALGGAMIERFSYRASFLGLAGVAVVAFMLLWVAIPETRRRSEAM
jgi:MFS family permease